MDILRHKRTVRVSVNIVNIVFIIHTEGSGSFSRQGNRNPL